MRVVAESFAWPFRGAWRSAWAIGLITVLLLPLLFVLLLGYAVAATRETENGSVNGPPAWRLSARLLVDGFWVSIVLLISALPFALLLNPLAGVLNGLTRGGFDSHVLAFFVLALPWGLVVLLVMPHATASFAASGRAADLFNVASAIRRVRSDFSTWNVVVAAIVTSWAIGVACAGLLCVGIVPGIFYAILVSAHATAALQRQGSRLPAG